MLRFLKNTFQWSAGLLTITLVNVTQAAPTLVSIHPLGGRSGEEITVTIRGTSLTEVHSAWFQTTDIQATVVGIETIPTEESSKIAKELPAGFPDQRVSLTLTLDKEMEAGNHDLRLVSPQGISNALIFHVEQSPWRAETTDTHDTPVEAQNVSVPEAVYGKIAAPGEIDFYQFKTFHGQQLAIEVVACHEAVANAKLRFRPEVTVYEMTGSWFDDQRTTRIAYNGNAATDVVRDGTKQRIPISRIVHRFPKAGRYFVAVSSTYGTGGPDYSYALRLTPSKQTPRDSAATPIVYQEWSDKFSDVWEERKFTRALPSARLAHLESRKGQPLSKPNPNTTSEDTATKDPSSPITLLSKIEEQEPNQDPADSLEISTPSLIEGTVQSPGDVDLYSMMVNSGQRLAVEIETPVAAPLRFNPRVEFLDHENKVIFSNLHTGKDGNLLGLEPKMVVTFENEGKYFLRVRDLGFGYGNKDFLYRIMLRPVIPHVGKIVLITDRLNVHPGTTQQLSLTADFEEDYGGQVVAFIEGLPTGVRAGFPTVSDGKQQPAKESKPYRAVARTIAMTLVIDKDAPLTKQPHLIRVIARPLENDLLGNELEVGNFPLMVVSKKTNNVDHSVATN